MQRDRKHIKGLTVQKKGECCSVNVDSVLQFIQDIIEIMIPIFWRKDLESPPVSSSSSTSSSTTSS